MTTIKAIETHYKGYRFRSRLEARWAVFFDALGVKWEYEKEGYQLSTGWYLPDFWLPDFKTFIEIKPENSNGRWEHADGVMRKNSDGDYVPLLDVVLIRGDPGSYTTYSFDDSGLCNEGKWASCPACKKVDFVYNGWCGYIRGCTCFKGIGNFYKWDGTGTKEMIFAITAARSARFEHGESGFSHG